MVPAALGHGASRGPSDPPPQLQEGCDNGCPSFSLPQTHVMAQVSLPHQTPTPPPPGLLQASRVLHSSLCGLTSAFLNPFLSNPTPVLAPSPATTPPASLSWCCWLTPARLQSTNGIPPPQDTLKMAPSPVDPHTLFNSGHSQIPTWLSIYHFPQEAFLRPCTVASPPGNCQKLHLAQDMGLQHPSPL